jgi:mannonate dehydratase
MKFTFRWYGPKNDSITLAQIRQITRVQGIVGALFDIPVGEVWPREEIMALKKDIESYGLEFKTVESVNVHEDIKLGLPSRDQYIANYITTLQYLAEAGVDVVCYNFMPIFDWTRTDLAKPLPDGSTALAFDHKVIDGKDPAELAQAIQDNSNGFVLPGWEPERLQELKRLFKLYAGMDEEKLFANLGYFLKAVVPEAEKLGIRMAIHPDDPPCSVFGLPRIVTNQKNLDRIVKLIDSPSNSLAICTGSLGSNLQNDIVSIVRHFGQMDRLGFMHVRNVKVHEPWVFNEVAHASQEGSLDLYGVMKALYDVKYEGPIRPDHGRMIWGEKGMPGYGLYDRALGLNYLCGLWDAICRAQETF